MKKSAFTETQILAILAEHEQGRKTADLCREHGISQPTFFAWRSKYAGMQPNQLRRACGLFGLSTAVYYRRPVVDPTGELVRSAIEAVMGIGPNWGFWKVYHRLRLDGHPWNHKRVYRIYSAEHDLEHGLHERRAGQRPALPHVQPDRR